MVGFGLDYACVHIIILAEISSENLLPIRADFVTERDMLVELAFTYQNFVALSAKLTKATTKVHTGCHLPIYILFLLGLCPK